MLRFIAKVRTDQASAAEWRFALGVSTEKELQDWDEKVRSESLAIHEEPPTVATQLRLRGNLAELLLWHASCLEV